MFGGGPLPKEFGNKLAQAGVTLYTLYGMYVFYAITRLVLIEV